MILPISIMPSVVSIVISMQQVDEQQLTDGTNTPGKATSKGSEGNTNKHKTRGQNV